MIQLIKQYFSIDLVVFSSDLSDGTIMCAAGALEANFVEPTHNKQDFEKTVLLQKLEKRLKEMTVEYW